VSITISGAKDANGNTQTQYTSSNQFTINTVNPTVVGITPSATTLSGADAINWGLSLTVEYNTAMNVDSTPQFSFTPDVSGTLTFSYGHWVDGTHYEAAYNVTDSGASVTGIAVKVTGGQDHAGNTAADFTAPNNFNIDMVHPAVASVAPSTTSITTAEVGSGTFNVIVEYSKAMDQTSAPTISFAPTVASTLTQASAAWTDSTHYKAIYNVAASGITLSNVSISVTGGQDGNGNTPAVYSGSTTFNIDMQGATVTAVTASPTTIAVSTVGSGTFSVTATYSEAMDTTSAPSISFSPDVTSTISFASGSWTDNTHYKALYNVANAGVNVSGVNIAISGAKDANGNTQTQYTSSNQFAINSVNPTVVGITPSATTLSSADAINWGFSLTAQYTTAMDMASTPQFSFTPDLSDTLAFSYGHWIDGTDYEATFNVTDSGAAVTGVAVKVTGGQDHAGNTATDFTAPNNFNIDMVHSAVASVTPSTTSVTTAEVGSGTFNVIVEYSKAMDQTSLPTISFAPAVASTLTQAGGSWTDGTHYKAIYDVADGNATVAGVAINVSGGKDSGGNTQTDYTSGDNFGISIGLQPLAIDLALASTDSWLSG
jgi:large repetitive protein